MRIRYREAGVELRSEWVDELVEIYPEGRVDPWRFQFNLYEDDPRLTRILQWFREHGVVPWERKGEPWVDGKHCRLEKWRDYEPEDYVGVRYVRLLPKLRGQGLFRDAQGRIKLIMGKFPRREQFVGTIMGWVVVPDKVKRSIEAEEFRGVIFRPTVLVGGARSLTDMAEQDWVIYGKPWWELSSDLVLPPLSPRMDVRDAKGNPMAPGDCSKGCHVREGLFVHPEYHYRAEDLAKVEPFDLARTAEVFGQPGATDSWHYITSARFREFCLSQKWKCDWIPVRIDE